MNLLRLTRPLLLLLLCVTGVHAQRADVFGSVGYGHTFRIEDESPGSGIIWGVGAGLTLTPRVRLEGAIENLDVLSHPRDYVANILYPRASFVYEFASPPIRPFVIAGAGALRIREVLTVTFPTRIEIREQKETAFSVHFGGGLAFQVSPRIAIRPQFVVIPPFESRSNVNLLHGSVQVSFSWS